MHLVVLLRWPLPIEAAAANLSELTALDLREARARLSADPPRLAATFGKPALAWELASGLGARGFEVALLDSDDIEHAPDRDLITSLDFGADATHATLRDGRVRSLRHDRVAGILQGVRHGSSTTVEETTTRRFSPGLALLSGGLLTTKKQKAQVRETTETREAFLYLYEAGVRPALALYEQRTSYGFLGPALRPSAAANFATVVERFRQQSPRARFDQRLMRLPMLGAMPLPPSGIDPAEWKIDLAAAMLTVDL